MRSVVILAFGSISYGYWAWNLAKSVKFYSPNIPIQLICDGEAVKNIHTDIFDWITKIEKEDLYTGKFKHPAKAKLSINKYLKGDSNIYLDADSIIIKDITPIFEACEANDSYYLSEVQAYAKEGQESFPQMMWADVKDLWDHFEIPKENKFPALNTSFQYLKKSKELDKLYEKARYYLLEKTYDYSKASQKWGKGNDPDELYMNAALAYFGHDASFKSPFYFPAKNIGRIDGSKEIRTSKEVEDNYYGLTYAGDGKSISAFGVDYYDSKMQQILKSRGERHICKAKLMLNEKFIRRN